MKTSKYLLLLFVAMLTVMLMGCTDAESESGDNETLTIFTSLYPLEDFTNKIGGEHVTVTNIMPPGADAHTYEPTQKTIIKIAEADAFIYNGIGLEPFTANLKDVLADESVIFVEAGNGITAHQSAEGDGDEHHGEHEEDEHHEEHEDGHEEGEHEEDEHNHGDVDPHVWLDPVYSIQMAENITDALNELKPEAKEQFEANFAELKRELEAIDQEFTEMVEQAPKRSFLVSHAAYSYWEDRYQLEQIAVTGLSPSHEPSQNELKDIIDVAKEHDIHYVLFEQNVSSRVAEMIQKDIGADVLYLHNLAVLTDDDIEQNEDYFSLMRRNIETMRQALQ